MTLLLLPHRGLLSPCEIFPSYSHCVKPASNAPSLPLSPLPLPQHFHKSLVHKTRRWRRDESRIHNIMGKQLVSKMDSYFPRGGEIARILEIAVVVTRDTFCPVQEGNCTGSCSMSNLLCPLLTLRECADDEEAKLIKREGGGNFNLITRLRRSGRRARSALQGKREGPQFTALLPLSL